MHKTVSIYCAESYFYLIKRSPPRFSVRGISFTFTHAYVLFPQCFENIINICVELKRAFFIVNKSKLFNFSFHDDVQVCDKFGSN